MNLLIVGTVAYDSVRTPFGARERILGGSAAYCATAASYFTDAGILAVVGEDFEASDRRLLQERGVDLEGLTTLPGQKCFHWKGEYGFDLNEVSPSYDSGMTAIQAAYILLETLYLIERTRFVPLS